MSATSPTRTHVPGTVVPALQALHDGWSLTAVAGPVPAPVAGRTVPATVPGSAHTDLLDAGLIPDPYLDRNEEALVWAHRTDWRYATTFTAPAAEADERVDLVMQGLDTVATVELNGTVVAHTANQHRSHRVDVRDLLASDGAAAANALTVTFRSALEHAEQVERELGRRDHVYQHPFNMVRKMACSFGWDWGPDLQTAGIWKPIGLERWRTARLAQVRPLVTVADDGVTGRVTVHVEVERAGLGDDDTPLTLRAAVGGHGAGASAEVTIAPRATSGVVVLDVPDVALWWPRGYGDQPLYDLTVRLQGPAGTLGEVARRIGFRTVTVDRTPDEHGTPFTFVVNGRPVFVKGANWIPDDHFLTRVDRARYGRRIQQAADAHMNLLRIWGGGIYENHDFYELCDEAGMLVWQDFLMACSAYAEEEPIAGELEAEARENVVRLMSHPSLVLWNGANENIWGYWDWGWPEQLAGRTWGLGYYTDLLPSIVAELDPTRTYAENSPYTPGSTDTGTHPNHPDHGTHHEWECWNRRDYVHYRDDVPRFCSEFGWQGPATWSTLTRAVPADALHKESASFLLRQKAEDGNAKLDRGLAAHLPVPEDFEDWHWATSLTQARAVSYAIEHYRSWWPRTAGSIVWQLNDCWPVTSWAAVDGDGRRKPLWYALRAAYADRLLTVQPRDGRLVIAAVNDTDEPWTGPVQVRRTTLAGEVLASTEAVLAAAPRSVVLLALPDDVLDVQDLSREVLVASAVVRPGDDGAGETRAVHTWAEDKDVAYDGDPVEVSVHPVAGGARVEVTARSFVRDLTLLADKVAPGAEVDRQLVSMLAGETISLVVGTEEPLDTAAVDALTSPRVLRSVNSLVADGR